MYNGSSWVALVVGRCLSYGWAALSLGDDTQSGRIKAS